MRVVDNYIGDNSDNSNTDKVEECSYQPVEVIDTQKNREYYIELKISRNVPAPRKTEEFREGVVSFPIAVIEGAQKISHEEEGIRPSDSTGI